MLLISPVLSPKNRNPASRRFLVAGLPTDAKWTKREVRGTAPRRAEPREARPGGAARGYPDCGGDGRYDGDGCRKQDRDRPEVTQPAAVVGAVVGFLFGGEGTGQIGRAHV